MSSLVRFVKRKIKKIHYYGSIWNYRHGFSRLTVELNGIDKSNFKSFLDDRTYKRGHPYNGVFSSIIDNKLYLPFLLKNYPEHVPGYFFLISGGRVLSLDALSFGDGIDSLLHLLEEKQVLALKQCQSSFGKGFYKLEACERNEDEIRVNGALVSFREFAKLIEGLHNYVCTEYVRQHSYSRDINPTSLNTLRFLCVRDYTTNRFFVSRCFHRFGSKGSVVDNLGGSGNAFLFLVDIERGVLKGNGMMSSRGHEVYQEEMHYPDGKAYAGMTIPNFMEVKNKVLEISDSFPFLRYIGWDVAITEDGFKIIEANSLTSLGVLQREGGYLEDDRLRHLFLQG